MMAEDRLVLLFDTLAVTIATSTVLVLFGVLLRLRNLRNQRRWEKLEQAWSTVLFEVLAGDRAPQILHDRIGPRDQLRFLNFLGRYARRVSGAERDVLRALATPYLPELAERAGSSKDQRRAWAIQTLARLGGTEYTDVFVRALDDPDDDVAMVAAQALARPEHAEYAPALYERLDRFGRWSLRALAPIAAGFGPSAAPALRALFVDPRRPGWVRAVAGSALFLLRDFASADRAAHIMREEQDRDLLITAAQLLGEYGDVRHLDALRQAAEHSDFVVRAQAIEALGRVGSKPDLRRVQAALADENAWVALRAARTLAFTQSYELLAETASSTGRDGVIAREALEAASR